MVFDLFDKDFVDWINLYSGLFIVRIFRVGISSQIVAANTGPKIHMIQNQSKEDLDKDSESGVFDSESHGWGLEYVQVAEVLEQLLVKSIADSIFEGSHQLSLLYYRWSVHFYSSFEI